MFIKKSFAICLGLILPTLSQAEPEAGYPEEKTFKNPITSDGGPIDLESIASRVILFALGLAGTIALLMFIWGGFQWMTSAGNSDKIKKGQDTMLWSALGLVVTFASYAIIRTVLEIINF